METFPNKIVIHHSGDIFPEHQFEKIDSFHKAEGYHRSAWGYSCFYVWVIEKDGRVVQARNESGDYGSGVSERRRSIDICLAGNFNKEHPTPIQEERLGFLLNGIMVTHNIPITEIKPHRLHAPSDCYGTLLSDNWAAKTALKHQTDFLKRIIQWIKLKQNNLI